MVKINIVHCGLGDVARSLPAIATEGGATGPGIFIICDRNVAWVVERLGMAAAGVLEIEATEQGKTLRTVEETGRWLMDMGADRNALVLGIGGGITTDIAGFAASVYKRGIRFAFLPTTLLAQVDASIGGKNGVNLDSFKNMLGVFRQPEATFICPETLETLPYSQILSGAAELLKTFLICNEGSNYEKSVKALEYARAHEGCLPAGFNELVAAAASVKAGIVGRDPEEHGERRLLNLGHTFAHAIEKLSGEEVGHGSAVSMGVVLAARLSEKLGLAQNGLAARLEADFKACGLPVESPFAIEEMAEAMKKDKKAEGGRVHFVLPLEIGRAQTRGLYVEDVLKEL